MPDFNSLEWKLWLIFNSLEYVELRFHPLAIHKLCPSAINHHDCYEDFTYALYNKYPMEVEESNEHGASTLAEAECMRDRILQTWKESQ